ncbi:MAG: hypothetical protein H7A51_04230 [Akkermansiaceae bacterium]|nr:hypothetical protein [Akkermansiaceae bacterium]
MSRYKPMGVSFLPERIAMVDDRAKQLGLSRSKYLQALVEADIDAGLLDSTKNAANGKTTIKLRDGVTLVALDKKTEHDEKVKIIVEAVKTLTRAMPQLFGSAGNVERHAKDILRLG